MTGFLMIIYAIAASIVVFEIGRHVYAQEKMGRCDSCAGTGRLHAGTRCRPCAGTGRAPRVVPTADPHDVTQPSGW
jgi:hypothetical protein